MSQKVDGKNILHLAQVLLKPPPDQTEKQAEEALLQFSASCPDPLGAMHLLLDAEPGTTAERITATALALPQRKLTTVPHQELSKSHPLRRMVAS